MMMDKMLASMLGITPDKMGEMIVGFQKMISDIKENQETILQQQGEILAIIRGANNDECSSIGSDDNRTALIGGPVAGSGNGLG